MFLYFWILIVLFLNGGNCKSKHLDPRVVGGKPISIRRVPYQALLISENSLCGGSIISDKLILTAAHCTMNVDERGMYVKVGSSKLLKGGTTMEVKKFYNHPDFDQNLLDNDVAIVELKRKLKFGEKIAPLKLNFAENHEMTGQKFRISGWGVLGYGDSVSKTLQATDVYFVPKKKCKDAYRVEHAQLTGSMMCAASRGKDACQGDSGGPLVSKGIQYGIVSWGLECAHPDYPGIYTNIATVQDFIKKIMKD